MKRQSVNILCLLLVVFLAMQSGGQTLSAATNGVESAQTGQTSLPSSRGVYLRNAQAIYNRLPVFSEAELTTWPLRGLIATSDMRPTVTVFLPFRVNGSTLTQRLPGLGFSGCPFVSSIQPDSQAARAGLQAGDEILAVGTEIFDCDRKFANYAIGETVDLYVRRNDNNQQLQATLAPALSENLNGVDIAQRFVPDVDGGLFLYELTPRFSLDPSGVYCLKTDNLRVGENNEPRYCFQISTGPRGVLSFDHPISADLEFMTGDRWTFEGSRGNLVTLDLQSSDFDSYLELYGPDEQLLVSDDDGGIGRNSLIAAFELPSSGQYTVLARDLGSDDTGAYELGLYNQTIQSIEYGESQLVEFGDVPVNVWQFQGAAGDLVSIRTNGGSDVLVRLINVDSTYGNLEFVSLERDTLYTIVLLNRNAQRSDLEISLENTDDVMALAKQRITFGNDNTGQIRSRTGAWLRFSGREGEYISALLDTPDAVDLVIQLYDSMGNRLLATGGFVRYFQMPSTGQYALRLYPSSDIENPVAYTLSLSYLRSLADETRGELVLGNLVSDSLSDVLGHRWTFQAKEGDRLIVAMESSDFDTYLELYSPDSERIATNDDYANQNSAIVFTAPVSGRYLLLSAPLNIRTGNYEVLLIDQPSIGEDFAGLVGYGDYSNRIEDTNSERWLFYGRAGEIVTLAMDSDDFDTFLELYGPDATQLMQDDDGGPDANSRIERFTLLRTGLYSVKARSYNNSTGDYRISLRKEGVAILNQGRIELGQNKAAQIEVPLGHLWTFRGNTGQTVAIEMSGVDFDPTLTLNGIDGMQLAFDDDSGQGQNARIVYRLPNNGDYSVIAKGYLGQTGSYRLTLGNALADNSQESPVAQQAVLDKLSEAIGIEFVYVPPGDFLMGSSQADIATLIEMCQEHPIDNDPDGCDQLQEFLLSLETPQHTVNLASYWIGKTEITNAQYNAFVEAGGYDEPDLWTTNGWAWRQESGQTQPVCWSEEDECGSRLPTYPVQGISWYEATAYANWLARETGLAIRLPTEAEWEKAARGNSGAIFPWGDEYPVGNFANFCDTACDSGEAGQDANLDDGYANSAPVGSYPLGSTPYGALDMAGNATEWTSTLWGGCDEDEPGYPYPYDAADGREEQESGETDDADCRVIRGFGWILHPLYGHVSMRYPFDPSQPEFLPGLRLVLGSPNE